MDRKQILKYNNKLINSIYNKVKLIIIKLIIIRKIIKKIIMNKTMIMITFNSSNKAQDTNLTKILIKTNKTITNKNKIINLIIKMINFYYK